MRAAAAAHPSPLARMLVASFLGLSFGPLLGAAEATVTITRASSPVFYVAAGSVAKYVAYRVTNDGPGPIGDTWATIGGFSPGVFQLADFEDGWYHVGFLQAGQSSTAYFLLEASGTTGTPQTHQVSIHGQPWSVAPPIASATFGLTCESTVSATSVRLTSSIVSPTPLEVGSHLTMYVDGETGTLGASQVFAHSAATLPSWPADKLELVAAHVETRVPVTPGEPCDGAVNGTFPDQLYVQPMPTSCYRITYTFRCTNVADATEVSPNIAIASGQLMKHSGNVTSEPMPASVNQLRVEHEAAPAILPGAGTTTCTVRVLNEGASPAGIDLVVADLPAAPAPATYVPGTAKVDGLAIPDPVIDGQRLWFGVPGVVPAGGQLVLTFDAQVPATLGQYTFAAEARVAAFVVDGTLDPTDNAPATATVTVGTLGVEDRPGIAALHGARPDPVLGNAIVSFELARNAVVDLAVTDLQGRTVAVLVDHEDRPQGRHAVTLSAGRLVPGVYILSLRVGERMFTRRLTVLR